MKIFTKIIDYLKIILLLFKIFFYYLFNKQIENFKHSVIELIIMLTKTKRKVFYNTSYNNKIDISDVNNNNDLAILIPGQLRNWEQSKNLIFSLSKKHHIFIFTDPEFKNITKKINNKKIHFFYSDEEKYKNKKKYIFHKNLNQWFKLHCLIEEIYNFEKKNNYFFKCFIKIRTDFAFLNQSLLNNIESEMNTDCLFTKSDLIFSGRREFFLPLGNFFETASQVYANFNHKYLPICTSQIINSDFDSYRFHWFKYPYDITGPINQKIALSAFNLKRLIKDKENEILKFNKDYKNKKLTDSYGEDFSSEQLFARYLNMNNIICKNHDKFAGSLFEK